MHNWRSDNLLIPLGEFIRMFRLTKKELGREGASGRLLVTGIPVTPQKWKKLAVSESSARAWMRAPDLPPGIKRKINRAGGFDCLDAWRQRYFDQVQIDPENNTITLPDGERISDVRIGPKYRPN